MAKVENFFVGPRYWTASAQVCILLPADLEANIHSSIYLSGQFRKIPSSTLAMPRPALTCHPQTTTHLPHWASGLSRQLSKPHGHAYAHAMSGYFLQISNCSSKPAYALKAYWKAHAIATLGNAVGQALPSSQHMVYIMHAYAYMQSPQGATDAVMYQ